MSLALSGKSHGKFANYLATSNIKKYIPQRLWPKQENDADRLPQGITLAEINSQNIKTYDAEDFIEICIAFVDAQSKTATEILGESGKRIYI